MVYLLMVNIGGSECSGSWRPYILHSEKGSNYILPDFVFLTPPDLSTSLTIS